jgi:hypothetical protein
MYSFNKKFYFIGTNDIKSEITVNIESATLDEVIEEIKCFLLACGFNKQSIDEYFVGDE